LEIEMALAILTICTVLVLMSAAKEPVRQEVRSKRARD